MEFAYTTGDDKKRIFSSASGGSSSSNHHVAHPSLIAPLVDLLHHRIRPSSPATNQGPTDRPLFNHSTSFLFNFPFLFHICQTGATTCIFFSPLWQDLTHTQAIFWRFGKIGRMDGGWHMYVRYMHAIRQSGVHTSFLRRAALAGGMLFSLLHAYFLYIFLIETATAAAVERSWTGHAKGMGGGRSGFASQSICICITINIIKHYGQT